MKRIWRCASVAGLLPAAHAQSRPHLPAARPRLCRLERKRSTRQLAERVDAKVAMDVVTFMAPMWRLAGNPAFEQSQQLIFDRLAAAGLRPGTRSFPNSGQGWEQVRGTLRLGGARGEVLLSRETHRVALAINSFSTPCPVARRSGWSMRARAITRPRMKARTSKAPWCWSAGRSAGVATGGPRARRGRRDLDRAGAVYRPDETPDVLQWGNIPYDEALQVVRFQGHAARRPRACARNSPKGRSPSTSKSRRRSIAGRTGRWCSKFPDVRSPDQRVVLAAHVQEPGANDNASGCGTLLAAALGMHDGHSPWRAAGAGAHYHLSLGGRDSRQRAVD